MARTPAPALAYGHDEVQVIRFIGIDGLIRAERYQSDEEKSPTPSAAGPKAAFGASHRVSEE
jgi:hypothetical protein